VRQPAAAQEMLLWLQVPISQTVPAASLAAVNGLQRRHSFFCNIGLFGNSKSWIDTVNSIQ